MLKDKLLKAIVIVDETTKEILGMVSQTDVVQKEGISIIMDYSNDEDKNIVEKDGTFYWRGDE